MKFDMPRILVICAVFLLLSASPGHAYLDPGTASIVLQSIIAGVAAGLATVGLYWTRVKLWFSSLRSRKSEGK